MLTGFVESQTKLLWNSHGKVCTQRGLGACRAAQPSGAQPHAQERVLQVRGPFLRGSYVDREMAIKSHLRQYTEVPIYKTSLFRTLSSPFSGAYPELRG
jgi:hypothetical protein